MIRNRESVLIKTGTSLATGFIATIWLMFLGVDYPLLWGFLTFLFNYVPTVGSIIAAVPPALLALIQYGVVTSLLSLSGYLFINISIGSILEPRLLGHGLGLSYVKKIIDFHNGKISLDSKKGIGTKFYITLKNI